MAMSISNGAHVFLLSFPEQKEIARHAARERGRTRQGTRGQKTRVRRQKGVKQKDLSVARVLPS